jgi:hypothetical protein
LGLVQGGAQLRFLGAGRLGIGHEPGAVEFLSQL